MKEEQMKKLAPLGLWLSLLALLFASGWFIVRQEVDLTLQVSLALVVLGVCVSVLLNPESARRFLTGRQARHGSNALVLSLASLGILIVVNYLVYQNDKSWDLTEDQLNTLSAETLDTLNQLPEPVTAKVFVDTNPLDAYTEDLLKRFERDSAGKFRYEIVNALADPVAAQAAQVTRSGQVVLYLGQRFELVSQNTEAGLTSALVRLMSAGVKNLYFLTGHGERDLNSAADAGYSQLKQLLEGRNYQVQPLNLLTTPQAPADADAIVIAGPQTPLAEAELQAIKDYLAAGGAVIVYLEPSLFTQTEPAGDILAQYLQSDWGVELADNVLVDLVGQQALQQPLIAVGAEYRSHAITNQVSTVSTLFPGARSVLAGTAPTGVSLSPLFSTSADSWAETDVAGMKDGQSPQSDDADLMGPIGLAAAAENFASGARLVVVGDADFANNQFLSAFGNRDLLTAMVDWSTGQEDLISLTNRVSTERSLKIQPTLYTKGLIVLIAVFVLPGAALAAGIAVWFLRRRQM